MRAMRVLAVIGLLGVACGRHLDTGASRASGGTGAAGGSGGSAGSLEGLPTCDPSVEHLAYVDADGDGEGAPRAAICLPNDEFPGDELPDGYAPDPYDCDDSDATIGPWVADRPGDGIDRDCDRSDGVVDCAGSPTVCPCAAPANQGGAVDATCTGFDIALEGVEACGGKCGSSSYFAWLANRGTEAVVGPVTLGWSSGPVIVWVDGLGSGEVSVPIWIPAPPSADDVLTATALDSGDCDPTNDTRTAPVESALLCVK